MLRIDNISHSIAGHPLFDRASAVIPQGHKVGVVGRNGAGKTTLFRLIRGELTPDAGQIDLPARARVGGVAQEVPGNDVSLINTVLAAHTERATLLAEDTNDPARIAEIQARLADIDAWSAEARAATILKGLGFTQAEQHMPCSAFSGGWRMRVALAGVLFAQPDLLLLDEPTNYLDLEGALWLESYLAKYPHTVLIISHDRGLLNRAVGHILHLNDQRLTLYAGGYDAFAYSLAERRAAQAATAKKQADRRAHMQRFVDRFRAKATKAKQAQSRIKMLDKMEQIRAPEDVGRTVFTFAAPEILSPPILRLEDVSVGYDGKAVLKRMTLRIDQDDRIALLGRNGEGKSTLSKLLAGKLHPLTGQIITASKLRVGYFAQHQVDELSLEDTPLQHLQRVHGDVPAAKLRARLAGFGLGPDQAETAVQYLSGGQKARLSLLLATRNAPHLLILDEPTNHLDIESREALIEALTAYSGAVVLVSHDMHLLNLVADRLWLVKDGAVMPYEGDLERYRTMVAEGTKPPQNQGQPTKKTPQHPTKQDLKNLRDTVRTCEVRLTKIEDMRDKLAKKLADPDLYTEARVNELAVWQKKYAEIMDGLERAETLWITATERLERAENQAA